jgi:DNA polymerase-1
MSTLELARKTYAALLAQRDGHAAPAVERPTATAPGYAVNTVNAVIPTGAPADKDEAQRRPRRARKQERGPETAPRANAVNAVNAESPLSAVRYSLVRDAAGLPAVIRAVAGADLTGLDTETTGLDPRRDRVRLLQLAPGTGGPVFIIDLFAIGPAALAPLWRALEGRPVVGHNLAFDLSFLVRLGFTSGPVADTMLMSLLLDGPRRPKGYHSLEQLAQRELGWALDKEEQASDWSRPELSPGQLAYAARDAAVLLPLHAVLTEKIEAAGLVGAAEIEARALPALVWLSTSGTPFDLPAWEALASEAAPRAERLLRELDAAAPPRPAFVGPPTKKQARFVGPPEPPAPWNWGSDQQVKEVFSLLGICLPNTEAETLAPNGGYACSR